MSENQTLAVQVLLVDDEQVIHNGLGPYLEDLGHQVDHAYNGAEALKLFDEKDYDLALVDVRMPGMDGITLMDKILEASPDTAVVIVTAHGDMDMVVQALRKGAADFLTKPVKLAEMEAVLEKATRVARLASEGKRLRETIGGIQSRTYRWKGKKRLIAESAAMKEVRDLIGRAVEARCDTILIQGETGVGKEVVAREVHLSGKDKDSPFIPVSCPALPDTLVESELFGHVKGSFTGATSDKAGCFEMAHGGTLFLDEVADLSAAAQAKLLRVLETRSVRRVGGKKEKNIEVDVVAATNSPLEDLIKSKKFREDLYFRLNVFTITIPPLRERKEDIMPLAEHFLASYLSSRKLPVEGFSAEAENLLTSYDYPGNIRELRNLVERAVILARQGKIQPQHLNLSSQPAPPASAAQSGACTGNGEKDTIIKALERSKWNRSRAAEDLGISYATLRYRMKKYDISL